MKDQIDNNTICGILKSMQLILDDTKHELTQVVGDSKGLVIEECLGNLKCIRGMIYFLIQNLRNGNEIK